MTGPRDKIDDESSRQLLKRLLLAGAFVAIPRALVSDSAPYQWTSYQAQSSILIHPSFFKVYLYRRIDNKTPVSQATGKRALL